MSRFLKQKWVFLIFGLILVVHALILSKLIFFPYPELFIYPYLTNHGLKPYQQILDQHFPGLLFLPVNFDNLGLHNEIIARGWLIAVTLLTQILLFFVFSKILKSNKKALLVNFLYLFWQPFFEGWVLWIDSFLPLIIIPSFYSLYKKKYFLCGLLLGLGIIFKQTLIPLGFLNLIFVFWQTRKIKECIVFGLGVTGPIVLMLLYLASIGVLKDFWYWTVTFNLTIYAKFGTSVPPTIGYITRILLVYLPALGILFNKERRLAYLVFVFLIGSLAGVFDRADFVHFQPSLPFAVMATTLVVYQFSKENLFKIVMIPYILIGIWWLNIFYKGHISDQVFFFDSQTKAVAGKIRTYTKEGDKIFVFGAAPHLYQMSGTLPAGDIFVFQFPWFLKVAQGRVLEGLKKDKPGIIVSDRSVRIEGLSITKFAKDIDLYILENYHPIDKVGETTILARNNR